MIDQPHALLHRLGRAVHELRKARGWSRRELARRSGLSERFLGDVERGAANLSVRRLADLAGSLGTSPDALLRGLPGPAGQEHATVALLGLRGAGKSTVGRKLSEALGWGLTELDAEVESAVGLSLSEVFEIHGEPFYRRAEREALQAVLADPSAKVIATGGGIVTEPDTYALLRRTTFTVWLRARPEDHWQRVVSQGDTRPMEGHERAFAHLCAILSERERLYEQADLTLDTSGCSVEEVVRRLRAEVDAWAEARESSEPARRLPKGWLIP